MGADTDVQLLTNSRMKSFKRCRFNDWLAYELLIRPEQDSKALRQGTAYHAGQEILGKGGTLDEAVQAVHDHYAPLQATAFDVWEWEIERETVVRLLCGWAWRWENSPLPVLNDAAGPVCEREFALPLLNPETGRPTPVWQMAGKIDSIVTLPDGRNAINDFKLLGDDIGPDSKFRRRLKMDPQPSFYLTGARRLGFTLDTVLYDLTRKPTIKPTPVPFLDENKCKIVLDIATRERVFNKNGSPRQTGDSDKGWEIQSRPMTAQEWGEKLNEDIASRPDFYYQRVEVSRLDNQLAAFEQELWDVQRELRQTQLSGRWFRSVDLHCDFCQHFAICENEELIANGAIPEGFVRLETPHQELSYVIRNTQSTEEGAATATEACAAGS